jgi:post-segregation antitoxin (ccd killing protein)
MRPCRVCGVSKPLTDFYRTAGGRDGHRTECKACNLAERAGRYRENPEPARERTKRWQRENPERYRAKQREYVESGRKAIADRRSYLKRRFGLTIADYDEMLARQGGGCAICRTSPPERGSLHVDHDHSTGDVRGLLCVACNNALGAFRDSPDVLATAAEYVADRDGLFARDELGVLARDRLAVLPRS